MSAVTFLVFGDLHGRVLPAYRLALSWGVSSRLIRKVGTTDELIEEVEATLLGDGSVSLNDTIVLISGSPMWVSGTTNLIKVHRVGERR